MAPKSPCISPSIPSVKKSVSGLPPLLLPLPLPMPRNQRPPASHAAHRGRGEGTTGPICSDRVSSLRDPHRTFTDFQRDSRSHGAAGGRGIPVDPLPRPQGQLAHVRAPQGLRRTGSKRPRGMSIYDGYRIVINEAQRRLIMRALTNAMANDRRSSDLSHPMPEEWVQLIRLFSSIQPSRTKPRRW